MKRIQGCCGLVFLLGAGLCLAQAPVDTSLNDLELELRKHNENLKRLRSGELPANANDRVHVEAADIAARYATYRFAFPRYHQVSTPVDANRTMDGLYKEFERDVKQLVREKNKTKEFSRLFGLKVIEHGKKVLDSPVPIVQLNITRVLARSADLGQPELADLFVEILTAKNNDKSARYNDAVKYYALRGLADLMAQAPNPTQLLQPARADKVAQALMGFIKRELPLTPITPPDEINGMRAVRREAVRALGQFRDPGRTGKERPALVLLEVMANEGFNPEPRIDERMEAALGLARMRPGPEKDPDYQVGYAVQQIAVFLADFATYYSTDYKTEPRIPCRKLAGQLLEALEALKTDTKNPLVTALFDPGKPGYKLLDNILFDRGADPTDTVNLAQETKLPAASLFKSMPDAIVHPKKQ